MLFQIITEREERASVAIATNLPFSEWGTVFPDPRLVSAIVDRVTFNAHIIETGTKSYRLRTSKTATRAKQPAEQGGAKIRADAGAKSLDETHESMRAAVERARVTPAGAFDD